MANLPNWENINNTFSANYANYLRLNYCNPYIILKLLG